VFDRRIATEPQWRPNAQFTSGQLPASTRRWLLDDGSLTGRLIELNRGSLAVQRLYQGWQVPLLSERRLLGLPPRQISLVREVLLLLSGQPVVFARSVFPCASLGGSLGHLRRLRNKSLGAILFRHPGMHRSPFELALMPGDSDYLPLPQHQAAGAWGRRCRFEIEGSSLMVSEVFLQAFTPWTTPLPVHRTQRGVVSAAIVPPTK
jgi:chorismate--pyruvate lyase